MGSKNLQAHPIINDYLFTNENLDDIVKKKHNKDQFLEKVFKELVAEIHKKEINPKLLQDIDQAIISGHPDSSLYILFITLSMLYNHYFSHSEKANSICSIIESFSKNKIPSIIFSFFLQGKATLYRALGNTEEFVKLMEESIAIADKKSPRYLDIIFNYYGMLALQGKMQENGKYKVIDESLKWPKHIILRLKLLKVVNSIYNGNCKEGHLYNRELQSSGEELGSYNFNSYESTFKILAGDFEEESYTQEKDKKLVKVFNSLSNGKIDEALLLFNAIDKNVKSRSNLSRNLPLHLELCQRKSGMAKFLLKEMNRKGDLHYMDDLFLGRIQLLENDKDGADETFSRLNHNVSYYGAQGRLEFELLFAKEMQLPHILKLLKGWDKNKNSSANKTKPLKTNPEMISKRGVDLIIGKSPSIVKIKESIKKYATLKAPILVTGETGTGKELVARAIHEEGPHQKEPFLAINCGALTETLLQSELFGYVAGAFTGAQKERIGIFEAAGKGTVFLDEFGDISPKLQVSLLRVLEANEIRLIGGNTTRQIECKIVVATNIDLHEAVAEKKFREDLYFRLARFEIRLPALRNRVEDIPELIQFFLDSNNNEHNTKKSITNELLKLLASYPWPGNIRELRNEIERLCILNSNQEIFNLEHIDTMHFSHLNIPNNLSQETSNKESKNVEINPLDPETQTILESGFRVENRQNKIKKLFQQYKKLTRNQIIKLTNVGPSTATKDLKTLMDLGLIVRRSPTKSSSTDFFEWISK